MREGQGRNDDAHGMKSGRRAVVGDMRADRTALLLGTQDLVLEAMRVDLDLRVLPERTATGALAIARGEELDLMVLDQGADGLTVVEELARDGRFVPSIFVAAGSSSEELARMRSVGPLAILDKPIDLAELVQLVRRRLELPRGTTIRDVSLPGFLQLLATEGKSCSLRVLGEDRSGVLVFDGGELVDAQLPEASGLEAALEMCRWPSALMHVEPAMTRSPTTVRLPLPHILLEAARIQDEEDGLARTSQLLDSLPPPPPPSASTEAISALEPQEGADMSNVSESLEAAMKIEGAVAVALVDYESGLTLGTSGGGGDFNIDAAAAGNTEVVRAKMKVKESLGIDDAIEDILITLDTQYHLIRPIPRLGQLFFYLAIDRDGGNLGLARHKLKAIEKGLEL